MFRTRRTMAPRGADEVTDARSARAAAVTADAPARSALSFDAFYRRDRDGLHRAVAFAVGDHALAGDAVDEAMARAYQHWTRVGDHDDPAGWVYRVAVNWARSAWRRARHLAVGAVGSAADPAAPELQEPPDPALWAAVAALPAGQRDALVLRFVLDWPHERIASALHITPGTARSRVTRGLQRLRADLEVRT